MDKSFIDSMKEEPVYKIFLAGPIRGNLVWRNKIIQELKTKLSNIDINVCILNPQGDMTSETFEKNANHEDQINWETIMMGVADCILFDIPSPEEANIDNYARTTRFELGEWVGRIESHNNMHTQLVIWMNNAFPGKEYIVQRLLEFHKHNAFQNAHYIINELDIVDTLVRLIQLPTFN